MGKVILVEPEVPENTGFIARLCSNFDWELRLVDPCFSLDMCRETAANCQEKLDEAVIFDTLERSIEDLDFVVGTKPERGVLLEGFEGVSRSLDGVGLVLGPESRGLSNEELDLCDVTVHIGTRDYGSLNLSHAAGICMYSFSSRNSSSDELIGDSEKEFLSSFLESDSILYELLLRSGISRDEFNRLVDELKTLEN